MRLIFIFCFSIFTIVSHAEGIEFFQGTWAEALTKSKETGKLIFMDAFTTWCGPCKKMSAQTFPLKDVGEFYNASFINMKIDMEKGDGLLLAGTYSVNSYPTLLYIDGDGKLVSKAIGYMDGPKFISAGKAALKKNDKSDLYAKEYATGKRDYTTVLNYVRALNMAGKSSAKVSNEYINGQKDMTTPENLKFLLEATSETDSRIFDLFIKHKDKIGTLVGTDQIQSRILAAAQRTVRKAVEYKTEDLVADAVSKIKTYVPAQLETFEHESYLAFFTNTENSEGILKTIKKLPKSIEKNAQSILSLAQTIETNFSKETKLLSIMEQHLSDINAPDLGVDKHFALGRIYALNNKPDKAVKSLEEAIQIAKKTNADTSAIEQYLKKINKS